MWTTLKKRCPHANRPNNKNNNKNNNRRAEQNKKCVTHVIGQKCYPCRRLHSPQGGGGGVRVQLSDEGSEMCAFDSAARGRSQSAARCADQCLIEQKFEALISRQ